MKTIAVATLSDLQPGTCQSIEVNGFGVALCNVGGTIYAVDNTCPHAGGPLGEGTLHGQILECPWHGWRYDVRTGARPENPDFKVACYPVQLDGNVILVSVPVG